MNLDVDNWVETLRAILSSQSEPIDGAEIVVVSDKIHDVEVVNSEIRQDRSSMVSGLGLRVQRAGQCVGAKLGDVQGIEEFRSFVQDLLQKLRDHPQPVQGLGLKAPSNETLDVSQDVHFDKTLDNISLEEKINRLINLGNNILKFDSRLSSESQSLYQEWNSKRWVWRLGARRALFRHYNGVRVAAVATALEGARRIQGFSEDSQSQYLDLNWSKVAKEAAGQAVGLLSARPWEGTHEVRVLVSPQIVAQGMALLGQAIRADKPQYLDRTSLGQVIFSEHVTLLDDPQMGPLVGTARWDDEGHPTKKTIFVDRGRWMQEASNTQYLGKLGVSSGHARVQTLGAPAGIAYHNLLVEPGTLDRVDLFKMLDQGVLLETIERLDSNSWLFRGKWVKSGEIQYPVYGLWQTSLLDLWAQVRAVGRDFRWYGNFGASSLLLNNVRLGPPPTL